MEDSTSQGRRGYPTRPIIHIYTHGGGTAANKTQCADSRDVALWLAQNL